MTKKQKWELTSLVTSIIIAIIAIVLLFQIPAIQNLVITKDKVDPETLKPYAMEIVNGRETDAWEADGIIGNYRMEKEYLVAKVENEGYGIEAFYPYQLEEENEGIYIVKVDFDNVKYREFSTKPQPLETVLFIILIGMGIGLVVYALSYAVPDAIIRMKKNKKLTDPKSVLS